MAYGVTTTGFAIKRLPEIKAELERDAKAIFGEGVIVSPQSPMGQLIGLSADMIARAWEMGLDTYQSFDVDQAEGIRLDTLSRLRLMARATDESDADFRTAITNVDRARIDITDIVRAVKNLKGVTYAKVFVNDTDGRDGNGVPGHSVALVVIGGNDDEIAATLRSYVVPGIRTFGTTRAETTIDGFCRTIRFSRPEMVNLWLDVSVRSYYDRNGCPPPAAGTIAAGLLEELQGDRIPGNGDDITAFMIRSIIESRYPNVEFLSARAGPSEEDLVPLPVAISFHEIASFSADRLTVRIDD